MIYQYHCPSCSHRFDVVKSVRQMTDKELCEKCKTESVREFAPQRVWFSGTSVQHPEYNPGLGCIVNNSSHRKELCKMKGVEEIGNENPNKLHSYFDKVREEKRDQLWDESTRGWVGNE